MTLLNSSELYKYYTIVMDVCQEYPKKLYSFTLV